MANTEWELIGTEYGNCNCDYGCPCQFNGRPSSENGDCRYATFTQIDEGIFEGQFIAVTSINRLKDKAKVEVIEKQPLEL